MKTYYTQARAQHYNRTWRTFTEKTHAITLSFVESGFQHVARSQDHPPRILDVGCGTGVLLAKLAKLFPEADLYGVDASKSMLYQAAQLLGDTAHLSQALLPENAATALPLPAAYFDVITCTNTLHYAVNPRAVLQNLSDLLTPTGCLVMEDYVLRNFPFPEKLLEWAIKLYDPQHVRLYPCSMIQEISRQIDLHILDTQTFQIDLFCKGWSLLLRKR